MKKLVLSMAAAMMLVGCSTQTKTEFDLQEVYQGILDAQSDTEKLTMLEEDSTDFIESIYPGLTEIETEDMLYYAAPVTGYPCEVMLVEVKNEEDVSTVEQIMLDRIEANADNAEEVGDTGWVDNAYVQVQDNYVAMVVLPEGYTVPETIFSTEN